MRILGKYKYEGLLFLINLFVFLTNFKSGFFLSGWDTLHPEFDFSLNLRRLIFGVWRQEQGLGALAAHSHMADLPRVFLLWILNIFLPLSFLRYFYVLLMLFVGVFGVFYLTVFLFSKSQYKKEIGFLSALFYLFNLGSVQIFYVVFEMFVVQYAYLPWVVFLTLKVFESKKRRWIVGFFLINIFFSPQAYAAHLWYAFFLVYFVFLCLYAFLQRRKRGVIKKFFTLFILLLISNSFWLLPNIYFITTSSDIPQMTKQNRIFWQEYVLKGREYGYLKDIALNKGFYFSWKIYDFQQGKFVDLMEEWKEYIDRFEIKAVGYLFYFFSLLGMILAILKRQKFFIAILPFFVFSYLFLLNSTFPFNEFFDFLLSNSIAREGLRFIFNKFSGLLIFSYTLYFSFFLHVVFSNIKRRVLSIGIVFTCSFLIIFYAFPVLKGKLISDKLKVKIPREYFQFWDFMKSQPEGVVLSLPLHNFTGWQYYKWGYQGSGFIWFGLKQPILDRDFDRWSRENEQAYKEFRYALYAEDIDLFYKTLKKFNISYIFWDKNILTPDFKNQEQKLYTREIQEMLGNLQDLGMVEIIFKTENLRVYRVSEARGQVFFFDKKALVGPRYIWNFKDQAFLDFGDYAGFKEKERNNIYYPFRNLLTVKERVDKNILQFFPGRKELRLFVLEKARLGILNMPDILDEGRYLYADMFLQKDRGKSFLVLRPLGMQSLKIFIQPTLVSEENNWVFVFNGRLYKVRKNIFKNRQNIYLGQAKVDFDKESFLLAAGKRDTVGISDLSFLSFQVDPFIFSAEKIYGKSIKSSDVSLKRLKEENILNIKSKGEKKRIFINLGDIKQDKFYILAIEHRNLSGIPLRICLYNWYSKTCSLYEQLSKKSFFDKEYFLIPPFGKGFGYTLYIQNFSVGEYVSENEIRNIYLIPFDFEFVNRLHFYREGKDIAQSWSEDVLRLIEKKPFLYSVDLSTGIDRAGVLTLSQSYNPGWGAYWVESTDNELINFLNLYFPFVFGKKIKEHVVVNNWANGWVVEAEEVDKNDKIVLFFWPQYLQFVGFVLVAFTLVFLLSGYSKNCTTPGVVQNKDFPS